jgi:hypothetical protein
MRAREKGREKKEGGMREADPIDLTLDDIHCHDKKSQGRCYNLPTMV